MLQQQVIATASLMSGIPAYTGRDEHTCRHFFPETFSAAISWNVHYLLR